MKKEIQVWRQGDVVMTPLIQKINEQDFEKKKDLVLAEGEITGHAHRISKGDVKLLITTAKIVGAAQAMVLQILSDDATISHEEHEDIVLPKGNYLINIQREWNWFEEEARKVQD